jgi:hypothetical protein
VERGHDLGNVTNAKLGDESTMNSLWGYYKDRNITKEDLDSTLRTHRAAGDKADSALQPILGIMGRTVDGSEQDISDLMKM